MRAGTRTSQLALWQTAHVAGLIEDRWPDLHCDLVYFVTQGDRRLDRPLPEIGGKGLFTAELEDALRRGEIDIAVHSLKDLPVEDAPGLTIGAVLSREEVRDVLVSRAGWTLATLPQGAMIGTSSLRRQAQLLAYRPDLTIRPIRGNVDSRIRKVLDGEYHAAVLAGAGLRRLGLDAHISEWLPLQIMLPAPGQGALAVQCRADDVPMCNLLERLNDRLVAATTHAERQLLWLLGGGCSAPIAAYAEPVGDGRMIVLRARVARPDGQAVVDSIAAGSNAEDLARSVAADLRGQGVASLLSAQVNSPLAGKCVVITRPEHQMAELAGLLRAQGADVILAPSVQIEPLPDTAMLDAALQHVEQYNWLLFSSVNAVDIVCCAPDASRLAQDRPPGLRIAAIGPACAQALAVQGVRVDFVPSRHHGDCLAGELPIRPGERILFPRSAIARTEIVTRLVERGAQVDEIAVYTTTDAPLPETTRNQLRQAWDAIIFTSGSTVRGFSFAIAGDEAIQANLGAACRACIGPVTAAVASELGYTPQVVPAEHSAQGLVNALSDYYGRE